MHQTDVVPSEEEIENWSLNGDEQSGCYLAWFIGLSVLGASVGMAHDMAVRSRVCRPL
jgi:hypothetical protein